MAYGKSIKKNFYSDGKGDIAMPPLDEKPPVLDATEWSGTNQQQEPEPVQQQEVEEPEEQEVENDDIEEIEDVEELEETPKPQFKNKSQENNFKALRERAEKAEREREELMKFVLESKRSQNPTPVEKVAQDPVEELDSEFDFSVDDDALIEGKQAKKLAAELKKMKQQMKAFQSQSQESVTEAKIKAQYPDFDAVVNQQTVNQLNSEYPEIAATLRDTKDLYSKATAAYKIMKKFGIYRDTTYDKDKEVALKNTAKPRTVTSLNPQQGDSPLSKANAFANGMSKDLQAQLLKEMADARKRL